MPEAQRAILPFLDADRLPARCLRRIGRIQDGQHPAVVQRQALRDEPGLLSAEQPRQFTWLRLASFARPRSRGILVTGENVYGVRRRDDWQQQLPSNSQTRATRLYEQLDFLLAQKNQAERDRVRESKKHPIVRTLETAPGFGPIRAARPGARSLGALGGAGRDGLVPGFARDVRARSARAADGVTGAAEPAGWNRRDCLGQSEKPPANESHPRSERLRRRKSSETNRRHSR